MKKVISWVIFSSVVTFAFASLYQPRQYDRTKFLAIVERVIYLSQHPEEKDDIDDIELQFQMAEWVKRVDKKLFANEAQDD